MLGVVGAAGHAADVVSKKLQGLHLQGAQNLSDRSPRSARKLWDSPALHSRQNPPFTLQYCVFLARQLTSLDLSFLVCLWARVLQEKGDKSGRPSIGLRIAGKRRLSGG